MTEKKLGLDIADPFDAPAKAPGLDIADPFDPAPVAPVATATATAATPATPRARTAGEHVQDVGASILTGATSLLSGLGTLAGKAPNPAAALLPDRMTNVFGDEVTIPRNVNEAVGQLQGQVQAIASGAPLRDVAAPKAGPGIAGVYSQVQREDIDPLKSEELRARQAKLGEAEGFVDAAKTVLTDPMLLEGFAAEQIPNLALGAGGAIGTARQATAAAVGRGAATEAATAAGRSAAAKQIALSEGLQEAGPAAFGAETDVLQRSPEELMAVPAYAEMIAQGADPLQARQYLADNAALWAAPVGFIAGLFGGKLSAPLEADIFTRSLDVQGLAGLFSKKGAAKVAVGVAKEGAEEVVQEGGSQVGQNLGAQQTVDPERDLMAGVPEAAGIGAAVGGAIGGGMTGAGILASRPKGPLERVADEARGKATGYSAAAQDAERRAAESAAFPNDNPDVLLANLRQRADDPAATPEDRAQALTDLQALLEVEGRMLPAPGGFTVGPDGTAVAGAPSPRPSIAPEARIPGDVGGSGLTEQAPGPKPQFTYNAAKTVLDGDITTTSGKPFATETGASRHLKTAFGGRGQLTPVDGGWVVRAPNAAATPETASASASPAAPATTPAGTQAPTKSAAAPAPAGNDTRIGADQTATAAPAGTPAPTGQPAGPETSPAPPASGAGPATPAESAAPVASATPAPGSAVPDPASAAPAPASPSQSPTTVAGEATVPSAESAPASTSASATAPTEGSGDAAPASTAIQAAAATAATSPANDLPEPTQAQKEAGNYQKGHVRVAGLDISIENPAGTKRRPEWGELRDHYGYIKGTVGKDKDHIDVFLTERAAEPDLPVFVVDQRDAKGGFDEHKVILGATSIEEAKAAYKRNYTPGWRGMGAVTQMTPGQFRAWSRDPHLTKIPAKNARFDSEMKADAPKSATQLAALPQHAVGDFTGKGFYKGWRTATVSDGPHKGAVGFGRTDDAARENLVDVIAERERTLATKAPAAGAEPAEAEAAPAKAGVPAPTAEAKARAERQNAAHDKAVARNKALHAKPDKTVLTLPWPSKGRKTSSAGIEIAQDEAGFSFSIDFTTNESGHAAPFTAKTYPTADAAKAAAIAELEKQLPKDGKGVEQQHVARIRKWLAEQKGTEPDPAAEPAPATNPQAEQERQADLALTAYGYSPQQLERMTFVQKANIRGLLRIGTGPGVAKVSEIPDNPTSKWEVYSRLADARTAPPPPPKLTAKQRAQRAAEVERELFRALTTDPAWVGQSIEAITAELKARTTAGGDVTVDQSKLGKLATAIHKDLVKKAAEIEKAKHRDPDVYAAAVADAAGAIAGDALAQFQTGFQHAMAGKTKSSLVGDRLPDMLNGYAAAMAWRKTDEGRAWYEGRPVAKLENTGADLRRHWELLKAEAAKAQSDATKAWAALERATNRARLFAPLLPDDVPPGVKVYVTELREHVRPFREWLESGHSWYGNYYFRSRHSRGVKSNLEYMLEGKRYPSERGGDTADEDKFQTDEAYRIAWLQERAAEYLEQVRVLLEPLQGRRSVQGLATAFDTTVFKPGMAAETVRQLGRNYQERAKDRDNGISDLKDADRYTATGLTLVNGSVWDRKKRKDLFGFTPASAYVQTLIEKETTIELPTKATPLTPPKLDHVTREGLTDQRKGRDVTPAEFKATFGFADVGFGKWVGAKQDQDHLNYAFDAFLDLARHFGLPPKAIGLGGRLHFTIGALGHGKAAAHFQRAHPHPDGGTVPVINLTNTKGDGTVYHEWLHAFDLAGATGDWSRVRAFMQDVFVHGVLTPEEVRAYADRFLFGGTYWKGEKNGDKVVAATKGLSWLRSHRGNSEYKRNSDALGKDYWGNPEELLARAGEAWAADTLGGTNTYLVNPGWVGAGAVTPAKGYRGTPYPSGTERTFLNEMFTALAKATTLTANGLHVSHEAFLAGLSDKFTEGEVLRKSLLNIENMREYAREQAAERAQAQNARDAEKQAKADAERAEADRLAAAALAELEATIADAPPPSATPGELSRTDYEAIFDQAAAELREETQEQPEIPPPGFAPEATPAAAAAPAKKPKKGTKEDLEAQLTAHYAPGNIVYSSYWRTHDRVVAFAWNDGNWNVTVEKVKQFGNEWRATEPPRHHSTRPDKGDAVVANVADLAQQGVTATTGAEFAAGSTATAPRGAKELLAEAGKLGVQGADEALLGLSKLFGGPNRLNSFPGGFDEETYRQAKPHFTAALQHFQAAGRTLLDLYKALIKVYGDGIKEYLIRFSEEARLSATLGSQVTPSETVAADVAARLARGESFDWRVLFEAADAAFGGTQAEGAYTPKDAYDALEAGVNRYLLSAGNAFSPSTDAAGARLVVDKLGALTALLPTQTKRTAEQDEFQQFSTVPPFAYLANWVANLGPGDVLLEPSAGIGGLAVFGQIAGARLILNELSSRRAAVLQSVFPGSKVYQENAEQIDNILPADAVPSVVVMNPPFSATAGRLQGERNTMVGARHVRQALDRLAPGGRLVAIVGDGMRLDAPRFRAWWAEVQKDHHVRAVIPVDGSGYAKYGTTFDNVLLVIDKAAPADRVAPITSPAKAYSDLVGLLSEIRDDRPAAQLPANDRDGAERDAAESARAEPVPAGERDPGTGPVAGEPGVAGDGNAAAVADVGADARAGDRAGGSQRPGGRVRGAGNRRPAGRDDAGGSGGPAVAPAGGPDPGGLATGITVTAADTAPHTELTDSTFEAYRPQRLDVPGARPHPGPLVQSAAMASVLPPAATYTPNLPPETISQGLLSLAQIEAVVYAGQAHSELLPDETRRAFFIGDGTGVGKGREIGGIILDNLRQGRTKAVWVTEKQDLFNDARRDFKAVGGDPELLFNQGKAPADGALKAPNGIVFTTYDTLKSGANLDPSKAKKATAGKLATFKPGVAVVATDGESYPLDSIDAKASRVWISNGYRRSFLPFSAVASIDGDTSWNAAPKAKGSNSRLQQLVDWLGPDFDGALLFDEAHNAGNAVAMKSESGRGTSKPSEKALAVVELQKLLPNARIVYVSATGATTVSNLAYAQRLGLWGKGTPFADVHNFVAEMTAGGLATMELVARDMKQMGAYIARSLSFDGVEYDRVEHVLDPLQRDIYDRLAEAWQVVLNNMNEALKVTGAIDENGTVRNSKAVAAARSAFWGTQQRFFNQIITAMQMPSVLSAVEADLAAGHAVVMQLVNTNEAQQDRALAKKKDEGETDLEDLDLTPRDALLAMVEKAFPVIEMETTRDENGNKVSKPVLDSSGQPVENKRAVAMREALLGDLRNIRVPDGPLEILLNHFGPDTVAEVTGRSQRVVRREGEDGVKAVLEKRGAGSNKADADAFLADRKRILIFSDAGGTGYSFHADRTKANQRRRMHYLLQPGWRADKAVQGLGRSHRTNQASAPRFRLVATDIPAHKRFLSAIARRLDMLGAMTKGQRDTANQGLFSEKDNLESKYATQAVRQLLDDAKRGQVPGLEFMPFLTQLGLEGLVDLNTGNIPEDKYPPTRQFLNRMLSLTLLMQETVFTAFIERMEEKIEVAAQRGELDAGMQTVRALSTRVVQDETVYTDPRTGATTRFVELELTLPNRKYEFPEPSKAREIEYVVNTASDRVWAKIKSGTETLKSGAVVDKFRMLGTGGLTVKTAAEVSGANYRTITEEQARERWATESAARPDTFTRPAHMIVGALLPIWDRLKTDGTMQVMRTQTTDGQRLLGRVVQSKDVPELRRRLDVSSPAAKLSPSEVMAQVLRGSTAQLANGWTLVRAKVSDDLRLELKAGYLYGPALAELTGMGVIQERINWENRLFVPVGSAGVPVLTELFKSKPVVDLNDPAAAASDEPPAVFLRDRAGRFAGKPMAVEAVQAVVDRLAARLGGLAAGGFQIHVAPTFADLPEALRQHAEQQGVKPHEMRGALHRGALWILAANARSAAGVERTVFHEAYGHAGMRLLFGKDTFPVLSGMARAMGGLPGIQRYAAAAGIDLTGYYKGVLGLPNISNETKLAVLMDELLAHIAQDQGHPTLRQRALELLGRVRAWLAEHGFIALSRLTEADLARVLQLARRAAQGAPTVAPRAEAATRFYTDTLFLRAFHGSPYTGIERFSLHKIGTGEGAQAFGWGLYFASNREVAEYYRQALTDINTGEPARETDSMMGGRPTSVRAILQSREMLIDRIKARIPDDPSQRTYLKAARAELARLRAKPVGQVYEVEIPDEAELLDWDKPLSEQPEKVRTALEAAFGGATGLLRLVHAHPEASGNLLTGGGIYKAIATELHTNQDSDIPGSPRGWGNIDPMGRNERAASEMLYTLGIPGLRYLDQFSRTPNQTDARLLRALERSDRNIEAAADAAMRGVYNTPKQKAAIRAAFINRLKQLTNRHNYVIWDESRTEVVGTQFSAISDDADALDFDLELILDDPADPFVNNGSGESSASVEAQNRLRDEAMLGRTRVLLEPDGTVRPLFGVDAVDTFARKGQIIVQRHIGRDEWTIISQDTALSDAVVRGRLNAASERLAEAAAPTMFHRAPPERGGPALDALGAALQPDPGLLAKLKSKGEDWRPAWLGALTLRHLAELGAKILPQIGAYNDVVDAMSADRNQQMERTAKTADTWAELQAKDPVAAGLMAQLMHDSTIAGVDPSEAFRPGTFPAGDLGGEALITPAEVNRRIQVLIGRSERSDSPEYQHAQDARVQGLRDALATEQARRRAYPELVARWTDLPDAAKALFVEVRKTYEDASDATLEALAGRIMKLEIGDEQKTALVDRLRLQFEEARVQGPYFPLARFGDFWHAAVDADGEKAFFMYETHREWKAAKAQLAGRGYTVQRSGRKISKARQIDGASGGFIAEVEQILEAAGVEADTRDEVYQLYLRTLPDLSQRKHFIHRKKVEGYSDDALRAFGANMFHGAHQLARLKHTDELAKLMREMQGQAIALADDDEDAAQRASALYNEMLKRNDWVLNPKDSALVSKISALGFVYYLGITPAAAFTNLTQTLVTALPVIGSRYGFGATNKALLAAGKLAGKHILKGDLLDALTGDEREAYRTWLARGVIDVTQAHNLAALSEADTTQFNREAHKAMEVTSFLFHRTEVLNRQTTALAAYRLARKGGLSHEAATDYAAQATWESHFDYSNANRARFMQNGAAKVLLMFRQYSLNMTWYLLRNAHQAFLDAGLSPAEKAEARKKLMGTLGMTGLFAGALGLPLMWAVFGIANALHALFDDDDEPWDAETAFQNWLAETVGGDVAETLTRGVGNGVFGIDLASRTSLNHLWLREADRELEGRDAYHYYLEQAAGPVGGMFANLLRAKQLVHEGQVYRAIETALPKAVKDGLKAWRYSQEGVNTLRGDPLVPDVAFRDVLAQLSGFTPAEVAQRYDANRAVKGYEAELMGRRDRLLDGFALAFRMEDPEAMAKAQAKVIAWNTQHPELGINGKTLERSIRSRQRYSLQSEDGIHVNPKLAEKARAQGQFAE